MTNARGSRRVWRLLLLWGDEFHIVQAKVQSLNGFLDQVGILLADVAEFQSGNANEELAIFYVAVAGGLEPGVVGVAINFFLESLENLHPGIDGGCGSG